MTSLTAIILQGKVYEPDRKKERSVTGAVLLGGVLCLGWMLFLFPHVFIDIRMVVLLLFAPGLVLTPLLYKRILTISGYRPFIAHGLAYNGIMPIITYLLVTLVAGNVVVTSFLSANHLFAQQETKTVTVAPFDIRRSYSRKTHDHYSHLDVEYDGIVKQLKFGDTPLDSMAHRSLAITVSEGLFGYYIIRERRLVPE